MPTSTVERNFNCCGSPRSIIAESQSDSQRAGNMNHFLSTMQSGFGKYFARCGMQPPAPFAYLEGNAP